MVGSSIYGLVYTSPYRHIEREKIGGGPGICTRTFLCTSNFIHVNVTWNPFPGYWEGHSNMAVRLSGFEQNAISANHGLDKFLTV